MARTLMSSFVLLSAASAAGMAGPRLLAEAAEDGAWSTRRVGGDLEIQTAFKVDRYVAGESSIESPLPVGYPAPTPPGAIELKRYPEVRRAEVSGGGDPHGPRDGAFWSLFEHIQDRDIAMTSPVEMDYHESPGQDAWAMSFLYRTSDLGPTGTEGRVRVVDTEPITVVSIGVRGPYGREAAERGLHELTEWLEAQDEWERAAEPRGLYYNGPYTADHRKWAEIQIPVRRISERMHESTPAVEEPIVMSPMELIELAVQRGAPLFNDHQPEACRAIYEVTIQWLLATSSLRSDSETTSMLRTALEEMRGQSDSRDQAWTLRHALDAAYMSLADSSASRG